VRITLATALVLQAIARGHRYGFEIVDVTGYPTGTVYPALRRLEHAGYLHSRWEAERRAFSEARPQRRNYEITAAGSRALAAALERLHLLRMLPAPGPAR
jgi:PadR family transcriptional regulator PadR